MEGMPSKILGRATLMAHDLRSRRFHPEGVPLNQTSCSSRLITHTSHLGQLPFLTE